MPTTPAPRPGRPTPPRQQAAARDQTADGYVATIVSGEIIAENGVPTAARPRTNLPGRAAVGTPFAARISPDTMVAT
ncbi:hypothetical protein MAHJHV45_37320 [Mycobacterium avium subsp. hominissuis]